VQQGGAAGAKKGNETTAKPAGEGSHAPFAESTRVEVPKFPTPGMVSDGPLCHM
jgi:hypothetical protein